MHGAQKHLFVCMPHSPQKCTCTRACAPMQRCRNFFAKETVANLSWVLCRHCTCCCLPPALLLFRHNQLRDAVCSRKPFKSTLDHDAFAAVVSHKHHSKIRGGAGLLQFVYGLHSKLGHGAHLSQKSFFATFRAFWQLGTYHCHQKNTLVGECTPRLVYFYD